MDDDKVQGGRETGRMLSSLHIHNPPVTDTFFPTCSVCHKGVTRLQLSNCFTLLLIVLSRCVAFHFHLCTFMFPCRVPLSLTHSSLFFFISFPAGVQDMMDDICQEQFMEMSYLNGGQEHGVRARGGMPVRGRGVSPAGAHRCGDACTFSFS